MRKSATLAGAAAFLLAVTGQAAEVTGTVISNDPSGRTVVVRTADGQTLTIRTDDTTRIQQGDAVVESTTLMRGVPVQIVTQDVVTGETDDSEGSRSTVVPHATRILLVPAAPAQMADDDDVDVDVDTDDDDDVDVDTDDDDVDVDADDD
jgi:hypothetical protein